MGIVLDRDCKLVIKDDNDEKGSEKGCLMEQYFSQRKQWSEERQKLAEWDPYTRPIITEKQGYVKFVDVNKETLDEITSADTGMTSQLMYEWKGVT